MTKLALITGASRGLGAALAEALAPGHHVMAVARTTGALEELDDRIKARGGDATLAPMDVTDAGAMAHMCRSIFDRWGHVDLWLHCAIHAAPLTPAGQIDARDWKKSVEVNANATATLIPMVEPLLRAAPAGRAVFFDDDRAGQKFFGSYGATKATQIALARSWQAETRNTGPWVDILTPAPMATATRGRFFPGEDRSQLATCADEATRLLTML
ncbi:SDR family NAD(P)-dependent oxidoreductase [Palleronia salina]|nr:SDR family NAD(P)-dependent oxidoreductase [Palleronia salina]